MNFASTHSLLTGKRHFLFILFTAGNAFQGQRYYTDKNGMVRTLENDYRTKPLEEPLLNRVLTMLYCSVETRCCKKRLVHRLLKCLGFLLQQKVLKESFNSLKII